MSNPFLEGGESTHEYNGQMFVVDCYSKTWQCSDGNHWVRARASTKEEAINDAHKMWDNYLIKIGRSK
jgi:hypothetical protein